MKGHTSVPRFIAGGAALALLAVSLVLTVPAGAATFRMPIPLNYSPTPYPTSYYDLDSSGGLEDWNCGTHTYNGHRGSDFGIGGFTAMDAGRDVVAGADGTVTFVHDGEWDRCITGDCGSYGNYVRIVHDDGKETYYAHLRQWSVTVAVNDVVTCGQKLGEVGSSGNSTGPHLHFEVRVGGSADDPFTGPCGGPLMYWVDQGAYMGTPVETCETTTPQWGAQFISATYPQQMESGETAMAVLSYDNIGTATWTSNTRLGTTEPRDRTSEFYDSSDWISAARATAVDSNTGPGQTGTFTFFLLAPVVCQQTAYTEHFNLLEETVTWFSESGQGGPADNAVSLQITVSPVDADSDTYNSCDDCDDNDPDVYPGAPETCDGKDNDCDGSTDPGCICQTGDDETCYYNNDPTCRGLQVCENGQWGPCLVIDPSTCESWTGDGGVAVVDGQVTPDASPLGPDPYARHFTGGCGCRTAESAHFPAPKLPLGVLLFLLILAVMGRTRVNGR